MIAKKKNSKEVAEALQAELKFLRGMVREVGEGFILRKEGEIETLLGYLAVTPTTNLTGFAPQWLRDVRDMKVKPAKGRLKDLKRLDSLLEELLDCVIDLQEAASPARKDGKRARPRAAGVGKPAKEPLS